MSKMRDLKRWLIVAALVSSSVFAVAQRANNSGKKGCNSDDWDYGRRCQQVPEGGSSAGYLLTVGAVALGALGIRSRRRNSLYS